MKCHKCFWAVLLAVAPSFGGTGAVASLDWLLSQADAVVVATASNATAAAGVVSVSLTVVRSLKGSTATGSKITATFSSPNVVNPGTASGVQSNGAIVASQLNGRNGLWFLQQSGSGWVLLPLVVGDISTTELYVPIPPSNLSLAFAYDLTVSPKKKLMQEIGAAASDPSTSSVVSGLAVSRALNDFGSEFQPVLTQLASSPRIDTMAVGLAGLTRLGFPSSISTIASIDLGALPPATFSLLANSICEYRNTDIGGIAALGALIGSAYSEIVRFCSAHALREIHSRATLPVLQRLLDDTLAQIQYDAVIGIAQYAMSFPVSTVASKPTDLVTFTPPKSVTDDMRLHYPSQGLFAKNPQEYISFWKTWLSAQPATN